jgi:predicted Rossmann fold nucleotide-binding protein DprA/Smf involved in DNA uptake
VRYDEFLAGLRAFRAEFAGEFWLEVFLMAGVNAEPGQVARIAALANDLRPDRVQLNTAVRPPADPRAQAVPLAALHSLAGLFSPVAEVPSAPAAAPAPAGDAGGDRARAVFDLVSRHPATAADVAASLGMDVAVARSILAELERSGRLRSEPRGAQLFYGPVAP